MLHVHQGACLYLWMKWRRDSLLYCMLHSPHGRFTCPLTYANCSTKRYSSRSFVSQAHRPLRVREGSRQRTCLPAWPGARSSCGGISSAGSVPSAVKQLRRHRQSPRRRQLQRSFPRLNVIRAYRLRRLLLLLLLHLPMHYRHHRLLHLLDSIAGLKRSLTEQAVLIMLIQSEPFIMIKKGE